MFSLIIGIILLVIFLLTIRRNQLRYELVKDIIIQFIMDRVKGLKTAVSTVNRYVFNHLELAPADPILGTATAFLKDTVSFYYYVGPKQS